MWFLSRWVQSVTEQRGTQHLSPKSGWSLILCPHVPFTPSTRLSPKSRSSCFKKWFFFFFFFNMVFCYVKHLLLSGWSLNITDGVYNQIGGGFKNVSQSCLCHSKQAVFAAKTDLVWMKDKTPGTQTLLLGQRVLLSTLALLTLI